MNRPFSWKKSWSHCVQQPPGLYIPHVKSFDSVERGQILADIIDPLTGVTVAQTEAPEDGIVFFAKDSPLVMENETLFKIVNKLHK